MRMGATIHPCLPDYVQPTVAALDSGIFWKVMILAYPM